jgi:hypothetical protein
MSTEALSDVNGYGVHASRPTAGVVGRLYFCTTHSLAYRDNGSSWDTLTVAAGGGGGLAQSFVGYDAAGASWETLTTFRCYYKSITLASAAQFQSIDVYLRPSTDNTALFGVMIADDNSGAPGHLIASGGGASHYLSNSSSMPGAARWLSIPVGAYLGAGTYWIGFESNGTLFDVAYDGSGNDQYFTASVFTLTGPYPSAWAITTGTRKYSIRASILS